MKKTFLIIFSLLLINCPYYAHAQEEDGYTGCISSEWTDENLDGYKIYQGKVYHYGCPVKEADPNTFREIPKRDEIPLGMAQDSKSLFFGGNKLEGLHPNSYKTKKVQYYDSSDDKQKEMYFLFDKDNEYLYDMNVDGVDLNTVEIINSGYFKDKNNVYEIDYKNNVVNRIPDANPAFFTFGYNINSDAVYWYGKKIEKADPGSFEVVACDYSSETGKDKNNVYWRGELVYGVDSKSFTSLASNCYDKNAVYDTSNNLKMLSTLKELKNGYAADGRENLVNQTLTSAIQTYETKYPNYTPQPAMPKPDSPEEQALKKFEADVAKAELEETEANKQNMMKLGIIGIVSALGLGGIVYGVMKWIGKGKK